MCGLDRCAVVLDVWPQIREALRLCTHADGKVVTISYNCIIRSLWSYPERTGPFWFEFDSLQVLRIKTRLWGRFRTRRCTQLKRLSSNVQGLSSVSVSKPIQRNQNQSAFKFIKSLIHLYVPNVNLLLFLNLKSWRRNPEPVGYSL